MTHIRIQLHDVPIPSKKKTLEDCRPGAYVVRDSDSATYLALLKGNTAVLFDIDNYAILTPARRHLQFYEIVRPVDSLEIKEGSS